MLWKHANLNLDFRRGLGGRLLLVVVLVEGRLGLRLGDAKQVVHCFQGQAYGMVSHGLILNESLNSPFVSGIKNHTNTNEI